MAFHQNKDNKKKKNEEDNQMNLEDLLASGAYSFPFGNASAGHDENGSIEKNNFKQEEKPRNREKERPIINKTNTVNKTNAVNKANTINKVEKAKKESKTHQKQTDQFQAMSAYEIQEWNCGNLVVAGLDEAGRGPLAGPVVAAACILDPKDPILGLNDSKKLSEKKREELFTEITNRAICYSIVRIEQDVIDEVNILNATKMAMVECVRTLSSKPDKLLIDAIDLKGTGIPVRPIIKGDSLSVSIAAASILAKVTRDRIMIEFESIYPGYGFIQNKGYGTALHYEGIKKLGITPIHRKTFLKGWI